MRVNSITFPNNKPFAVSDLTVLIGPNNSGKSQLLRDITNCGSSSVATPVVAVRKKSNATLSLMMQ